MQWHAPSPLQSAMTVALTLPLCLGCQKRLPSAPSELTTGITVYERANFRGHSAHIESDISDLGAYVGPCVHFVSFNGEDTDTTFAWADCISSVRIAPGWRATLYRGINFHDESLDITVDVPNLQTVPGNCSNGGLNDCVSSVRVTTQ